MRRDNRRDCRPGSDRFHSGEHHHSKPKAPPVPTHDDLLDSCGIQVPEQPKKKP